MTQKPLLSLVIPSYNDRVIIRPFYEAIVQTLRAQEQYDWEVIYVDDGSVDGSIEELAALVRQSSHVRFLELSRNFGQQKAYLTGLKYARGDVVITLDGDYQYNPACLLVMAGKLLEGYDIVSGIRICRQDPLRMRLASWGGQYFIRKFLKIPVKDFGSVKAFSRFLVQQILKYETYCMTVYGMAFALSHHYAEIEVEHLPRPAGESKWSTLRRVHLLFDIFLGFSDFHLVTLTKIGLGTLFLGFITLCVLLYLYLFHKIFFFHTFTAVTALSLIGVGALITLGSFGLSFLLRIYRMLLWKGDATVIRKIYGERV